MKGSRCVPKMMSAPPLAWTGGTVSARLIKFLAHSFPRYPVVPSGTLFAILFDGFRDKSGQLRKGEPVVAASEGVGPELLRHPLLHRSLAHAKLCRVPGPE